jgi:hypothetical protein
MRRTHVDQSMILLLRVTNQAHNSDNSPCWPSCYCEETHFPVGLWSYPQRHSRAEDSNSWHSLESPGKREAQLEICLHQVGLSVLLWGIFFFDLVVHMGGCVVRATPEQVVLATIRIKLNCWKQATKQPSFVVSASVCAPGPCMSSCPDFPQWSTVTWEL